MEEKLRRMKEANGITLVALIITIILLVILAAVTIRVALNGGIIELATDGALKYASEQQKELGYINELEDKLKDIEESNKKDLGSVEGKLGFSDLTWNNAKASVAISKKEQNEYKIEYKVLDKDGNEIQGYKEIADGGAITELELGYTVVARLFNETQAGTKYSTGTASITVEDLKAPTVTVTKGGTTTKSITVTVSAADNEAGMPVSPEYTYYIKKSTEENYSADKKQTATSTSCTFDNLEQNKNYDIKVEVKDIAGNLGAGELTGVTTGGIPDGAGDGTTQGAIVFENLSWASQKASVTIRKTITENYTIKYRVVDKNGTETVSERDIASGGTVGNLNLGDMVIARLTDGVNYGNTASITVEDKKPPTAPTFGTVTGTAGTNGWHKSEVTVPINAGTDAESGVLKTTYTITGAGAKGEAEGTSVSISAQGISVITAYTYDKANNKTSSVAKTINIDTGDPNTATTAYVAHDTSTITVKTTAQDTLSGLAKVEYQYSTNGSSYTTKASTTYSGTTAVTTNNSYTFTGLTAGTKYWLRIRVTDMAGRVTEGGAITQTTKAAGLSSTELASKIGAYVDYQPDTATNATYSTTQDGAERSGYGEQMISRDTSLTWRIMSVSGNTLTLIATTQASSTLTLQGQNGYNNGVKLLNDACNTLYKNTTLGTTGRSVKVEDINNLMGVTPSASLDNRYGSEDTPSYKCYPYIFRYERWGSINGSYTGNLGQSEQSSWYSGGGQASTLKGKWSDYSYVLGNYVSGSTVQHALATCQSGNSGSAEHDTYWLASRSVEVGSTRAYFNLFKLTVGSVDSCYLSSSEGDARYENCAVRPCISVDLNSIAIGATGSGTISNKYSISKR